MAIFTKANIDSQEPEQRKKAIEKLNIDADQSLILEILIEDSDLGVKEVALTKISDTKALAENLANLSTDMQMATCARIVTLLQIDVLDLDIKKTTLTTVAELMQKINYSADDEKIPPNILVSFIFDALIKEYPNLEINLFILDSIKKLNLPAEELQEWFTKLAVTSPLQEIRLAALENVTDENHLQKILSSSKKHKKVKKEAQEKLQKLKQERFESEKFEEKCHRLALAARELSLSAFDKLFISRFEYLQKSWLEVSFKAKFKDKELFESCMQDIQARISAEEQIQFAAQEAEQQLEKIKNCISETSQLIQKLQNSENLDEIELNSIKLKIASLEEEVRLLPNSDLDLTQKFNVNVANLHKMIKACEIFSEKLPEFEKLLENKDANSLNLAEDILMHLNLNSENLFTSKIKAAFDKLNSSKKNTKISRNQTNANPTKSEIAEINKNLAQLDKLLQEGQLKLAIKTSNQIKNFFKNKSHFRLNRQEQKFRNLNKRLLDLKKWQDSIAEPKRIEICEQLEFLIEENQMDLITKAEKIKHLQQQWRELGADGQSDILWERYKKAADLAYAPCKEYLGNKAEKRKFNTEQREIICNELEFLLEQDFFNISTSDYYQIINEAKRQWRLYSPVSGSVYKKLQNKYIKLLQASSEKRDEVNKALRARKLEILDKSKELLSSEKAKAEDFKALKNLWFEIDSLPRKEEREKYSVLMRRIKDFFDRNQALREKEQEEQKLQEKRIYTLVDALSNNLEQKDLEEFKSEFKEFELLFRSASLKLKQNLQKTSLALKDKFNKIELWTNFEANKPIKPAIITKEKLSAEEIIARLNIINGAQKDEKSEVLKLQIARLQQRKNLHIKDDFTEVCLLVYIWQNLTDKEKQKTPIDDSLKKFCLG